MPASAALLRFQKTITELLYSLSGVAEFAGERGNIAFFSGDEQAPIPCVKCGFATDGAINADGPVVRYTRLQVDFFGTDRLATISGMQAVIDYVILHPPEVLEQNYISVYDVRDIVGIRIGLAAEPNVSGFYVSTCQFNVTWRDNGYLYDTVGT